MKVLVACEESQAVCKAFREKGHYAFSCDYLPGSGGFPEWHLQMNVIPLLDEKWDMIIAHPPCTYLSNAGARHLFPKGILNEERLMLGLQAKEFFMAFYNADCDKICIENPVPSKIFQLPECSQIIQPWMFGHPYQKRTCLWLKGLEPLKPTHIMEQRESTRVPGNWFNKGGKERQCNRSKTFAGIAKAMAEQWG